MPLSIAADKVQSGASSQAIPMADGSSGSVLSGSSSPGASSEGILSAWLGVS